MTDALPNFDSLWDYDHPDETERRFTELLPAARTSGDADYTLELLTQIARTQGLGRKFDEAHRTLDEVEAALTPEMVRPRIRYLLERGRVLNSSKQREQARPLFLAAWEGAQQAGEDFYAIDAAHMMGIIEPPEHRLGWNLKAVEIAEKASDNRARNWLGSLYNNIGWTYHDAGQYEAALATFQKALDFRTQQGDLKNIRIARWCIARTLRSLNRIVEALNIQQALLRENEQRGEPDGYVYEEIAECLYTQGSTDAARYFKLAYEALSADLWLADNEPDRLARLKNLGENGP